MTQEELVENLGTIAHSGSKEFVASASAGGGSKENIIGQFGVGFYSTFMVGSSVDVFSRSYTPGTPGYMWASSSDTLGTYTVAEAENVQR